MAFTFNTRRKRRNFDLSDWVLGFSARHTIQTHQGREIHEAMAVCARL
jgi:hypothetical protein